MRSAHYSRDFDQKYKVKGSTEAAGELYSYTTVYAPPTEMEDKAPYIIGLIKLDSGEMVTAPLTDCEEKDLRIGMRMEMVVRRIREKGPEGLILYGYKFRPAWQQNFGSEA